MSAETIPMYKIPLGQLVAAEANRERMQSVTQESLADLAEAMQASGQLQPIVVRQIGENQYRIVAGERRFRAAQRNGWETINATIKDYSTDIDEEVDRAMENLQRVNLPPLVEAHSIGILRQSGLSVGDISRRIGIGESAVYSRLRLNNLSPAWRTELENSKSDYSHLTEHLTWLEELAALPQVTQDEIIRVGQLRYARSLSNIKQVIQRQMRRIADAPFDDKQFPAKERCAKCPHRTDQIGLFPEYNQSKTAQCCRVECWGNKCRRWLVMQIKKRSGEPVTLYNAECYAPRESTIPGEVRELVADWPYANFNLYESSEEVDGEAEPVLTLHVTGERIGNLVTMYRQAGDSAGDDVSAKAAAKPEPTPLQLACREILEQYMPEQAAAMPGETELLRLVVELSDNINLDPYSDEDDGREAVLMSADEIKAYWWRQVWWWLRDMLDSRANGRYCHSDTSELRCWLEWAGVYAEALTELLAATQSDSEGDGADDADGEEE